MCVCVSRIEKWIAFTPYAWDEPKAHVENAMDRLEVVEVDELTVKVGEERKRSVWCEITTLLSPSLV